MNTQEIKTSQQTFEQLRDEITVNYDKLSKRLQKIALFALDHPTDMAIETIAIISKKADVQPSALIRFAQYFQYSGFSEMQKSFQSRVVQRSASYRERIRDIKSVEVLKNPKHSLLQQYCQANILSLQELELSIKPELLTTSSEIIRSAENVYIMAQGRSFSVATYLSYALNQAGYRAILLNNTGGILSEIAKNMRSTDALISISFAPYSAETRNVVSTANGKNMPVIVITDNCLSPIAGDASVTFEVQEAEVHHFRSLTSSMCIAQTLATLVTFQSEKTE